MHALLFFVRLMPPPLMRRLLRWHFDSVRHLSPPALAIEVNVSSVLLLDVRTRAEYESSHIVGAIRVADGAIAKRLIEAFRTDSPGGRVVAYCTVGYRSAQFALRMASVGCTQIENLEGGIWAWAAAGQPIIRATSS